MNRTHPSLPQSHILVRPVVLQGSGAGSWLVSPASGMTSHIHCLFGTPNTRALVKKNIFSLLELAAASKPFCQAAGSWIEAGPRSYIINKIWRPRNPCSFLYYLLFALRTQAFISHTWNNLTQSVGNQSSERPISGCQKPFHRLVKSRRKN